MIFVVAIAEAGATGFLYAQTLVAEPGLPGVVRLGGRRVPQQITHRDRAAHFAHPVTDALLSGTWGATLEDEPPWWGRTLADAQMELGIPPAP